MVTFGLAVDGDGDDGDFLDQQPDQGDDFMSDDDDDFLHQQSGQSEDDDDIMSDDDDDDDYWSAQGDDDNNEVEEQEDPLPVQAPPAAASEAAIAALETVEAPADDCCPVCLQDGGGEAPEPAAARPWRRVAPCGHRFHAACVDRWLRVKLSCPVCRCPAAPPAAAAPPPEPPRPIPDIVEEFLAVGFVESYAFDKTPRWMEYIDDRERHNIAWDYSWEVS